MHTLVAWSAAIHSRSSPGIVALVTFLLHVLPAILAGADRDIREAEARDVEVVEPVGVRLRRGAQIRIAAARTQSAERLRELVGGVQGRVVQAAVGRAPGQRAGADTQF